MSDEKEFKKEWQTVVAITPRPGSWQELARAVTSPALRANQHLNHIYLADVGCGATLIGDEIVNHARGYIPPKERQTSGKEAKIDLPVYTEEDWKAIAQIVDERVRSSGDFTGLRIYGGVNEAIYKRMTEAHSVGSKVRKILEIARAAGSHITKAEKSYAEVAESRKISRMNEPCALIWELISMEKA